MEAFLQKFLLLFALPSVGLPAIFTVSLISATWIPMGSEPALFTYIKLNPTMFWAAILVATAGNTAGGMIDWWLGYGAKLAVFRWRTRERKTDDVQKKRKNPPLGKRYVSWMRRYGPLVLLLSWVPGLGDPLCTLAGWLRLPWRACLLYMAIGKFLRYCTLTALLLWIPTHYWDSLWHWLKSIF